MINVKGNKSISNIAKSIVNAKDKSCIYKFLSKSNWDEKLLNRNRISHIKQFLKNIVIPESIAFLSNDDTINKKSSSSKSMAGLGFHYSHIEGKNVIVWLHQILQLAI